MAEEPARNAVVGQSAQGGIVAAATVLTSPAIMQQDGIQYAVQADKFERPALRVVLRRSLDPAIPARKSPLPRPGR
jgi:hypothetical protein